MISERAAISGDTLTKLLTDLAQAEPLAEAFVVSTCNRVRLRKVPVAMTAAASPCVVSA